MIRLREKIGYGFGDMASSMFWKLFGAYLMIFYTDVFGLPAAMVGTMFLVTRVWDSVFDPIVGVIADRSNSRWGKFRPYILVLAVPFGLIGALTFYTPPFGDTGKLVYAYVTYSLMMMVYSGINVPYASLLGVMSPNPSERNTLSTFRMMFAYIGSFIALLLFMPMANAFSGHSKAVDDQQTGWFLAATVIAALCVVLFFGCFSWTRERVKPINDKKTSLKTDIRDLLHNRPWWILFVAGVGALVFNSIRDGGAVYYFKYYIVEENFKTVSLFGVSFVLSGLFLALGQMANIVGVVLAAPVSNKLGKKRTFALSMLMTAVLSVVFYWFDKDDIVLVFVFQCIISMFAGSIFPPVVVDVRRLCRLFRAEHRQPRHRTDILGIVNEPEIRLGHRHGAHRMAAFLLRLPRQRRAERGDDKRHQDVSQLAAGCRVGTVGCLHTVLSVGRREGDEDYRTVEP